MEHRLVLQTMVMTGSDLCTSAKPWDQQLKTVSVIYEEFYIQVISYQGEGFRSLDTNVRATMRGSPAVFLSHS